MTLAPSIHIQQAVQALTSGGIIAYPTEAVWGLGVDPNNSCALRDLLALKHRSWRKGLILLASDIAQVEPWLALLSVKQRQRVEQSWPGPVTWLLPNHELASSWVTGDFQSVAIRVTNHPVASALCRAFGGPIISTSANRSGCLPVKHAWALGREFQCKLSVVVPGQCGQKRQPTEIRNVVTDQVIRKSS